jgi:Fe-S cluster assembly protein SufD
LVGSQARALILGAVVGGEGEIKIETLQHHLAPDTQSELIVKSVIFGAAHFSYKGLVRIEPGAQRADAYQENKNLLIGEAKVDTRPQLEILANDVHCAHGAAVGRVDQEALFYLMSRGIEERQAKSLFIKGFFEPLLKRVVDKNALIKTRQAIYESLEEAF